MCPSKEGKKRRTQRRRPYGIFRSRGESNRRERENIKTDQEKGHFRECLFSFPFYIERGNSFFDLSKVAQKRRMEETPKPVLNGHLFLQPSRSKSLLTDSDRFLPLCQSSPLLFLPPTHPESIRDNCLFASLFPVHTSSRNMH